MHQEGLCIFPSPLGKYKLSPFFSNHTKEFSPKYLVKESELRQGLGIELLF